MAKATTKENEYDTEKAVPFGGGSEFDAGESGMLPHTPFQNNPDVADQVRGDPRIDGPYLDDIRAAQAQASRQIKDAEAKQFVDEKRKEAETKLATTSLKSEKKKGTKKDSSENVTGKSSVIADGDRVLPPQVSPVKASAKEPVKKAVVPKKSTTNK